MSNRETNYQWLCRVISELPEELLPWDNYPCFIWPFSVRGPLDKDKNGNMRYGQVYMGGTVRNVPRLAWSLKYGNIPEGLFVLHRCDIPRCFRPSHLFIGTREDNTLDCLNKGRMHIGESNKSSKLIDSDVLEIRRRYKSGERQCRLASQYGVDRATMWAIVHGEHWKHLL